MRIVDATPLMMAAEIGATDIARSLIEYGASVDETNGEHNTPLHFAAGKGLDQMIELLIQSGANVNARNSLLFTLCMEAAWVGRMASIKAFIEGKADLALQDEMGRTALHHAAVRANSTLGLA